MRYQHCGWAQCLVAMCEGGNAACPTAAAGQQPAGPSAITMCGSALGGSKAHLRRTDTSARLRDRAVSDQTERLFLPTRFTGSCTS
jgi:hypothetical protein